MTEDELAQQFEKHRKKLTRFAAYKYQYIDPDTIDGLYTECWISLKDSTFKLMKLRSFLEESFNNRIKNYLRNKASSQDLMDRLSWVEPEKSLQDEQDTRPASDLPFVESLADERPGEAAYLEDLCGRVQRALESVPPTLVIIGEWYYVHHLSQAEIAQRLQCSQPNVSIMLGRFRAKFARNYHHLLSKEL